MKKRLARASRFAMGFLALVAASALVPATAAAATWAVDPNHTEVNFAVDHFFTPVNGKFEDFEVDLHYDSEQPENSRVEARISVASINTGNEKRDNHLRSADFFEVAKYPYMIFKSTSVRQVSDDQLVARGNLTIKGQSREIELPIKLLGTKQIPQEMQPMLGGSKKVASFNASTSVDRGDFGVGVGNWAATLVVGGEVDIDIVLEAHLR